MLERSQSPISRTLTLEECWSLLAPSGVGRVVVTVDGLPRTIPLNYSVAGDVVYFRTAPESALNSVSSQKVAFEADTIDPETRSGWSVCVVGSGSSARDGGPDVDSWAPAGEKCGSGSSPTR
ncbi:MAG TPA: pyridoxamine 5'-phosphate oxidase family protein [Acidimicrobiales bacterium]|nr:pyridoxamine 5'-phosphate oxidase family protein [Acidimicrobiales bacterium]